MLILAIIIGIVLVLPLAYNLGVVKAIMIGAIMFSAVLTPIMLAHLCPKICARHTEHQKNNKQNQYQSLPNVRYPLLSGAIAAALGFMILVIGGQFIEASIVCNYTGYEQYTRCSYPWGFIHAGIAMILAIRLSTGTYPDVNKLQGFQNYRQWGDLKDAIICSLVLLLITILLVIPQLHVLRDTSIGNIDAFKIAIKISLMAFVLGFIVPTWYRAQHRTVKVERRKDPKERERFTEELNIRRIGVRTGQKYRQSIESHS